MLPDFVPDFDLEKLKNPGTYTYDQWVKMTSDGIHGIWNCKECNKELKVTGVTCGDCFKKGASTKEESTVNPVSAVSLSEMLVYYSIDLDALRAVIEAAMHYDFSKKAEKRLGATVYHLQEMSGFSDDEDDDTEEVIPEVPKVPHQ